MRWVKQGIGVAICLLLAGCGRKMPLTSLELKALQEREFETNKQIAFASTVSVLQDLGYSIKSTDYTAGLVFAESPLEVDKNFLTQNKTSRRTRVSAFVEEFPKKATIRLNFVTSDVSTHWFSRDSEEETVILKPFVYQQIFDKIGEAIFLREKMH